MILADVLELPCLKRARLVVGEKLLRRNVRWAHPIDVPDPLPWVGVHQFILTSGCNWPRHDGALRDLIRSLAEQGISALGLAVPQFFDAFPQPVVEEAERFDLALLEIPWEVPFAQVSLEVNSAIIAQQYQEIEKSERIHRALTKAAVTISDLNDLAATLGALIERDILFEDSSLGVLGHYSVETMQDEVRRKTLLQRRSDQDINDYFTLQGYFDQAAKQVAPLSIPANLELGLSRRLMCPVRVKDHVVGWLYIIEGEAPLSELDKRAAEQAALVAGLYVAHQQHLSQVRAQLGYTFLDALLEGAGDQDRISHHLLERARLMDFDAERSYCLAVINLSVPLPLSSEDLRLRERLLGDLRTLSNELGFSPLMSPSTNRIYLLLPDAVTSERLWERLCSNPASPWYDYQDRLTCLVGRARRGFEGVRRGYLELQPLLPHVSSGGVQHYHQVLLPSALQGDPSARQLLVDSVFCPLEPHAVLLETLKVFATSGFAQKDTAATLGIHVNSLRYRLDRIETLTSLDLSDAETQFKIQFAARLLSLSNK